MGNARGLIFNNYVIHNNIQWFWSLNFNALFSRNMESGAIKRWGKYFMSQGVAFSYVVLYRNKIIAVPHVQKKIMIFDIEAESFRFVDVKLDFTEENQRDFFSYITADKWLFVIGYEAPYILKFNMDTESVEEILDLGAYTSNRTIYFREAVLDKEKIILPMVEENLIFEIDIETLQWTSRKVGGGKGGFSAICKDENSIWLMPEQKGAILQWHYENDDIIFHEIEEMGFMYMSMRDNFHSGFFVGNKIWVFPFNGNIVLSIDLEKGEVSKENAINHYLYAIMSESGRGKFQAVQVNKDHFFLLSCKGVPLIYDPVKDELEVLEWKLEIPYEDYFDYLNLRGVKIKNETDIPLENFVKYVLNNSIEKTDEHSRAGIQCGYQIWKTINYNNYK